MAQTRQRGTSESSGWATGHEGESGGDWFIDQPRWTRASGLRPRHVDMKPRDVQWPETGARREAWGGRWQPGHRPNGRTVKSTLIFSPFRMRHRLIISEAYYLFDDIVLRLILKLFVSSEKMLRGE